MQWRVFVASSEAPGIPAFYTLAAQHVARRVVFGCAHLHKSEREARECKAAVRTITEAIEPQELPCQS